MKVLARILDFSSTKTSTILDFFAGSGTTLHAVMQLNAEDGGHRKCILVNVNENGICENVTYERNKRVINGYTKPNGEAVEGLHENSLRYYRVGLVPRLRKDDLTSADALAANAVNLLCLKHDVYAEQTAFGSLSCDDGLRYFKDDNGEFLVILNVELIEDVVEQLESMTVTSPIATYVATERPLADDFGTEAEKVDLHAYPWSMANACQQVMPAMPDPTVDMPDDVKPTDEETNLTTDDLKDE